MAQKIALITGGSRGLGRSAALHLAKQGIGVVLTYLSNHQAADTVVALIRKQGGQAVAVQLDNSKLDQFSLFRDQLESLLEAKFGRHTFDFLINNAGIGVVKPLSQLSEDEFDMLLNVHLKGVVFLTQALLPMLENGGRVFNVSSGLTRFSMPGFGAYASVKAAVEVYSRYLAQELGPRGIAVNTIAPGAIETDFGNGAVRDNPELNGFIASVTAMGRAGQPDDIGPAITSLLLHDSQWMTGQRIEVSGGMNL